MSKVKQIGKGKTLVIVPAYNEEGSIVSVINSIYEAEPTYDVLVVNDASKDNTSDEVYKTKAALLELPFNLGIGGAMQSGYCYAYEKGYEYVIQVDGDGQHLPREIKKLVSTMRETGADLVCGSRFLGDERTYKQSFLRRLGGGIFAWTLSLATRQKITDPTSGFRLINKHVIELFARDYPADYPEVEVVIALHRHNLKVREVAVHMVQRETGESSIRLLKTGYYMIKVMLAVFVGLVRNPHADLVRD